MDFETLVTGLANNWQVWLVTVTLIVAAIIDGKQLKVPNWLTLPMIASGWAANTALFGWEGLGASLLGTVVGLALLLPAYAIGGMGAGDVKLLAGVGECFVGAADLDQQSGPRSQGAGLPLVVRSRLENPGIRLNRQLAFTLHPILMRLLGPAEQFGIEGS